MFGLSGQVSLAFVTCEASHTHSCHCMHLLCAFLCIFAGISRSSDNIGEDIWITVVASCIEVRADSRHFVVPWLRFQGC
jgi:hypothetical protein